MARANQIRDRQSQRRLKPDDPAGRLRQRFGLLLRTVRGVIRGNHIDAAVL